MVIFFFEEIPLNCNSQTAFMMKTKILMVCLGNICRSPLAHGILESLTNHKDVEVDSAGTSAFHKGEAPDIRSIGVAEKHHLRY